MLELYNAAISTCSQKVRLVLAEKDIEWKDHQISFSKREHLTPEYLKLNPNGVVPTLLDDGRPVTDSSVINEYLEDRFPAHALRPADMYERARMRTWRQYIDEVPTVAIRAPSFNAFFVPIWSKMSDEEFENYSDGLPLRKHFYRRMGTKGFSDADIQASLDQLGSTLKRMEQALESGPWLMGDMYTLADVSITATIVRMEDLGLNQMWARLPRVAAWYERIQARPAFARAYYPGTRDLGPSC
jgi:glutathione S-transferase